MDAKDEGGGMYEEAGRNKRFRDRLKDDPTRRTALEMVEGDEEEAGEVEYYGGVKELSQITLPAPLAFPDVAVHLEL